MNEQRIDKWLWFVRIFKTRTLAVEACNKNRVTVNETPAKPARTIKEGDVIGVYKPPIHFSYRVLDFPANRVGAQLLPQYLEDLTPPEEYGILELQKITGFVNRPRGTGRPTKKDRRDLDSFFSPS
jgi:ribosome-associated heat shock protein Hsp15